MALSNQYKRVPCASIKVERPARQRRQVGTANLVESIKIHGVINPIIIKRDFTIIAGERRLTASRELGLPDIPCRFADDLSDFELQMLELDENIRREDLAWQDQTAAIGRLHEMYVSRDPTWSVLQTAEEIGVVYSTVRRHLRVYKDLSDPKVSGCATWSAAVNYLARLDERGVHKAMEMILEAGKAEDTATEQKVSTDDIFQAKMKAIFANPTELVKLQPKPTPLAKAQSAPDESILLADFLQWAPAYTGPKFNFVHFDPPYGIGVFDGKQSGYQGAEGIYDDSESTFWALLDSLLLNRNGLLQNAAHIMFWFSMDFYSQIFQRVANLAPEFTINPFPLVWHKSDGSAILPDPKRGARRSYETALLLSRGERFVVKAVSNIYSAPTNKDLHPSTKPVPMLKHFFQLFVDEHTYMLDPTTGSGSSLRAAESMGAAKVLGLEKDPKFHESACAALRQQRMMEAASKGK